jgi:hypothetical protein
MEAMNMTTQLTPEEKQEALFERWLTPKDPAGNDLPFSSPEAAKGYRERITRIKDAIQMKKRPDRVPVLLAPSFFPVFHSRATPHDVLYDYDKLQAAFKNFAVEFGADAHIGATAPGSGRVYEILDYKLYSWPGHGVAREHSYQCNEGEYMKADEYDALIQDPSGYFMSVYLPRVFGALAPLQMMPFLPGVLEIYGVAFNFIPFGLPPMHAALKALMDAGAESLKWAGALGQVSGELAGLGYPEFWGGFTKAPFDVIGDTLRGTKGIMLDMHRQPAKLLESLEALVPLMVKLGVGAAQVTGKPIIFIPLHKGADGFMSEEQYEKFYWPTLRKVMLGLIEQGIVPNPAAEGGYGSRLSVIKDLPKGKTLWMFDATDMAKAKAAMGNTACIMGNVPSTMLSLSSPQEVKAYCKNLIEVAGKGGGYVLSNGAFFDQAKPENLKAVVEAAKEHGAYN